MNEENKTLIEAATKIINELADDANHTVGSALITKSGKIITAINFYHFTGGPDVEVVALAKAASENETPVRIVAVGHNDRGVLTPCGRCRQTMFDYYPDIQVIIDSNGTTKSIRELLPDVYDWNAHQ